MTSENVKPIAAAVAGRSNKSLTPKMKAKIFKRDRCCQFEDPVSNRKCGSTFGLQIDHRTSRWVGGDHTETNLQVLCQGHNHSKFRKESFREVLTAHLMTVNKTKIAQKSGIGRRTLYNLMDPKREFNPELSIISAIIQSLAA